MWLGLTLFSSAQRPALAVSYPLAVYLALLCLFGWFDLRPMSSCGSGWPAQQDPRFAAAGSHRLLHPAATQVWCARLFVINGALAASPSGYGDSAPLSLFIQRPSSATPLMGGLMGAEYSYARRSSSRGWPYDPC